MLNEDIEIFKKGLIEHAKNSARHANKQLGEEATKLSLVLPFLSLLGYDERNPDEVSPEHHADFAKKFKNRVDFAILSQGEPIIAIECKKVGASGRDDRGQLKSYFNAAPTAKLGILTDGLVYEFFSDADLPNIMDDSAFLTLDLKRIARGDVDKHALELLASLRKNAFDPKNVGAEAKRKLVLATMVTTLAEYSRNPPKDFARLVLKKAKISKNISGRMIEAYRDMITQAFDLFIEERILTRLQIDRPAARGEEEKEPLVGEGSSGIITTEDEIMVYNYARERLAFLIKSNELFAEISKIKCKDHKTTLSVFYMQPYLGRLFNFEMGSDKRYVFTFPALNNKKVTTNRLSEIDEPLYESFVQRVRESGVSLPSFS